MRILLYNPDNGVTRNFMPHLWMFLLQALTPPGHEVLLIDGNAQPMDEAQIAQYVRDQNIGLVGIGAMTRMIASHPSSNIRKSPGSRSISTSSIWCPRPRPRCSTAWALAGEHSVSFPSSLDEVVRTAASSAP